MNPTTKESIHERNDRIWKIGTDVVEGRLATFDPEKYTIIRKGPFLTPRSDGTVERPSEEVVIHLPVTLAYDEQDDDDGCGSSSSSGNSMTGYRGTYRETISASVDPEDVATALEEWLKDYAEGYPVEEDEE